MAKCRKADYFMILALAVSLSTVMAFIFYDSLQSTTIYREIFTNIKELQIRVGELEHRNAQLSGIPTELCITCARAEYKKMRQMIDLKSMAEEALSQIKSKANNERDASRPDVVQQQQQQQEEDCEKERMLMQQPLEAEPDEKEEEEEEEEEEEDMYVKLGRMEIDDLDIRDFVRFRHY